jgi:hypothetical protein
VYHRYRRGLSIDSQFVYAFFFVRVLTFEEELLRLLPRRVLTFEEQERQLIARLRLAGSST